MDPTVEPQELHGDNELKGINLDLYRSNDYVQIHEDHVYLRPFVKVGETPDDVKVIKFPMVGFEQRVEPMKQGLLAGSKNPPKSRFDRFQKIQS